MMFSMVLFMGLIATMSCKKMNRCEIARELDKQGFPREQLPDWVCLVQSESSGNTALIGKPNKNGSRDYGLFQINDKYWCTNSGPPGKDCKLKCSDVITDDITKASECAKKIYRRHKFDAWYGWKNKCRGKTLPKVDDCFS